MEVDITLDMDKVDGATRILGTQTMLEVTGEIKVMEIKVAGANQTAISALDTSRDMVEVQ